MSDTKGFRAHTAAVIAELKAAGITSWREQTGHTCHRFIEFQHSGSWHKLTLSNNDRPGHIEATVRDLRRIVGDGHVPAAPRKQKQFRPSPRRKNTASAMPPRRRTRPGTYEHNQMSATLRAMLLTTKELHK
jgi:hypothetical protein